MKQILFSVGIALLLIGGALFVVPDSAYAQAGGLVPCNGPDCQACHVVELAQNVVNFFVRISFILAALAFAVAGVLYFANAGKEDRIKQAHKIFSNTFIGLVIILTSWLVVDVVLHALVGQGVDIFTEINCTFQQSPTISNTNIPTVSTATGSPGADVSQVDVGTAEGSLLTSSQIINRIQATEKYKSLLCGTASSAGIADQCNHLQAMMAVESAGNPQAKNGLSSGLMQVTPDAARHVDPLLSNLSDSQIQNLLISNPNKNIEVGTKYYQSLLEKYNGDTTLATAAYNGGPSANDPSKDCPGLRRWQCQWDNPEHTIPNTGYAETRTYVQNISSIEKTLGAN
jgi:hypothetical protein